LDSGVTTTLARALHCEGEPHGWGEHIPAWCKRTGNKLVASEERDGKFYYYVRRR